MRNGSSSIIQATDVSVRHAILDSSWEMPAAHVSGSEDETIVSHFTLAISN